ncbi:hypothetical protein LXL04_004457 [Taraxacum kok-saghyz]
MQSISDIRTTHGLPLCLSGVNRHHHLSLSNEIADHDRRREAMKRTISESSRSRYYPDEIEGLVRESEVVQRSSDLKVFSGDDDDDQSSVFHTPCTAKAA